MRYTIRSMMLAIVVVAGFLAMPSDSKMLGLALTIPPAALIGGLWFVSRSQRKLAAFWFGIVAASINLIYVAACSTPRSYFLVFLSLAWVFWCIPTMAGFGVAWATLATRKTAVPRRKPALVWLSVFFLTVAPLATLWTLCPLRVLFFAARPTMDRMADQAVAGRPLGGPRSVDFFRLAGSVVDPPGGDVGLLIDADPAHYSGFVKRSRGTPPAISGRMLPGSNLRVHLGGDWWYNEDD